MPQPTPYTRATDFSAEETAAVSGRSSVRTVALDAELDAVETNLQGLNANIALLQRDDGEVRDGVVKLHTLAGETRALLAAGPGALRGAWATATAYALRDVASQGGNTYLCAIAHTSGTFATDLAAGRWMLLSIGAAPTASSIPVTAVGGITAANVQAALQDLHTAQAATATDLAGAADPADGAGLVGYGAAVAYPAGTVGRRLADFSSAASASVGAGLVASAFALNYVAGTVGNDLRYGCAPSIFRVLNETQQQDVLAYGFTQDLTVTIRNALLLCRSWYFPEGGYKITDDLPVTSGMRLQGASSVNQYYGAQAPGHRPAKIWQATVGKAVFSIGGGVSDVVLADFEITARQNPVAYTGHVANTYGIRMMGANYLAGGTTIQQAGRSSYRLRFERIQGHHFERFISCTDYYWDTTGAAPPGGAPDWQCDSVVIDQCTSFGTLHGVYLQSINADAFNLRNVIGNVWTGGSGITLKRSGYFHAASCYWTPAETAAGVSATNTTGVVLDGFWDTVVLTNCVASDYITYFFDRTAEPNFDNTEYALILQGCVSEAPSRVQRRTKVISIGSRFTDDILCTGDDIEVHSIGDGFNPTTKRWVMSGLRPNLFVYGASTQTSGSTSCPNNTATTAFSLPVSAGVYNVQAWITGNTPYIAEATLICEGSQFVRIRGTNTGVSITVSGTNNVQLTQTFGSTQPVQWRWQRVA